MSQDYFDLSKPLHTESESIQYEQKLGSLPWLLVTRTSYCVSAAPFSFSRVYFRLESSESLKVVASAWCSAFGRFYIMSPLLCHFMLQCLMCFYCRGADMRCAAVLRSSLSPFSCPVDLWLLRVGGTVLQSRTAKLSCT